MKTGHAIFAACAMAALPALAAAQQAPVAMSAPASEVISDASRPASDKARDAARKPDAMLAFAGLAPGMRVFELDPGKGYFTRLFSVAVGPAGRVLAYIPDETVALPFKPLDALTALTAEPGRGNVLALHYPLMAPPTPQIAGTVDVVWTSQNYHDFHNIAGFDAAAFNRHILALLKPGGVYIVLDHAALAGAGAETTHTLHRIDKALVRHEIEAAGFVFDGESAALANPGDPHNVPVFDPSIRGHTDQFILRFRKPMQSK